MKIRSVPPSERLQRFRESIIDALKKEPAEIPAEEILAVISYTVGQYIAFMDQRKYTAESIMQLVHSNIEAGNRQAIQALLGAGGTPQ